MNDITKPRILRIRDLFWVALALAFTVPIALIHAYNEVLWYKSIGMWSMVVFAWTAYPTVLYWRWSWIRRIDYITRHGLLVITHGFSVSRLNVENETGRILEKWIVPLKEHDRVPTVAGTYVVFKSLPFRVHQRIGRLAGLAIPWKKTILVGYQAPLSSTAFAHELSHIILANAGLPADEGALSGWRAQWPGYSIP